MNSDFDFDPENGSRSSKLARGAIFCAIMRSSKIASKDYIRGPSVIFNSFVFL